MRLLIEKGLMFGNLFRVDSPALVERYNRALDRLIGKRTALSEFHLDISGFSPEIGDEFGDDHYLNHDGVNRQFILLSTEQKRSPLLNASFSTSRGILRQFIDANEAQLFALTARDAVAGELANSVYRVSTPDKLFDLRRVTIEADTTSGTVRNAAKLGGLIDRFKTERDAWFDDVLIAEMIELAKQTGDVTRNPVKLDKMSFEQGNFWTSHFGGLYVFRNVPEAGVVSCAAPETLGEMPVKRVIQVTNRARVAQFLYENKLAESLVETRGVNVAAILRQKMDFIVAGVASAFGETLVGANSRDLRALGRKYADQLPREWHGLAALVRWAEEGGPWPKITGDDPSYFYTLRSTLHADAELVNMLLAEMTPLDVRQLFICNKEAFYAAYQTWPETKRAYVADFLAREYMVDKPGMRSRLFGEQGNDTPPPPPKRDIIDLVGPWGALMKGRK